MKDYGKSGIGGWGENNHGKRSRGEVRGENRQVARVTVNVSTTDSFGK